MKQRLRGVKVEYYSENQILLMNQLMKNIEYVHSNAKWIEW
jgi:hypothetical protein